MEIDIKDPDERKLYTLAQAMVDAIGSIPAKPQYDADRRRMLMAAIETIENVKVRNPKACCGISLELVK